MHYLNLHFTIFAYCAKTSTLSKRKIAEFCNIISKFSTHDKHPIGKKINRSSNNAILAKVHAIWNAMSLRDKSIQKNNECSSRKLANATKEKIFLA